MSSKQLKAFDSGVVFSLDLINKHHCYNEISLEEFASLQELSCGCSSKQLNKRAHARRHMLRWVQNMAMLRKDCIRRNVSERPQKCILPTTSKQPCLAYASPQHTLIAGPELHKTYCGVNLVAYVASPLTCVGSATWSAQHGYQSVRSLSTKHTIVLL